MVRYTILAIFLVVFSCGGAGFGQDSADYDLVKILAPEMDENLYGVQSVNILWKTSLGDGYKFSVSFSPDGKLFTVPIAEGIQETSCTWIPGTKIAVDGWIKVKIIEHNGMVLDESVVRVSWFPRNAIVVSKANQRVYKFSDGELKYSFICSTALPAYDGTEGEYKVYSRERNHWSRKYEVWMPHSLFYHRGYAIHATTVTRLLGRPASHGCIRLHPRDAKTLYNDAKVGDKVIVLPKSIKLGNLEVSDS